MVSHRYGAPCERSHTRLGSAPGVWDEAIWTFAGLALLIACAVVTPPAHADHTGTQTVTGGSAYVGMSREADHVFILNGTLLRDFNSATSTTTTISAGGLFNFSSADGTRVIFSLADPQGRKEVYESFGGVNTRLSTGPTDTATPHDAVFRGASEDATHVYFTTTEQLVAADTDTAPDLYERFAGSTSILSLGPFGGNNTGIANYGGSSTDGTRVFFATSDQLTSDDLDGRQDVYEYSGGTVTRVSRGPIGGDDNRFSAFYAGHSVDGSKVFVQTKEALTTDDTDDDNRDTYVREGGTTTTLVSTGPLTPSAAIAQFEAASDDGTHAFFTTTEPMVPADLDVRPDLYERFAGTTTLLSTGSSGGNADIVVGFRGIATDGSRAFFSTSESLVSDDADNSADLYEHSSGVTTLVSRGTGSFNGPYPATFDGASADGTRVFFQTVEQLTPQVTNNNPIIYERVGGATYMLPLTSSIPKIDGLAPSGRRLVSSFRIIFTGPYVRPLGASPLRIALVPSYAECTAPDLVHGPPLEHGSCGSPQQASTSLTVGTPESNGATANSTGFVRLGVAVGAPGPPDDSDVLLDVSLTDVRCQAGVATCGPANLGGGDDYIGRVAGGPADPHHRLQQHRWRHRHDAGCVLPGHVRLRSHGE